MKKKIKKTKPAEFKPYTTDISVMYVEQDGYKASFTEKDQRELVAYLLAKVDGYSAMIKTLSKAIDLIRK
jgi:hypothetical protein